MKNEEVHTHTHMHHIYRSKIKQHKLNLRWMEQGNECMDVCVLSTRARINMKVRKEADWYNKHRYKQFHSVLNYMYV